GVQVTSTVDTLVKIAAALAAAINSDTTPQAIDFVATSEGEKLIVVNRAGTAFATTFQITPISNYTVDANGAGAIVVTVQTNLNPSKTWTLVLIQNGVAQQIGHTNTSLTTESAAQVAAALASVINGASALANFTASADGNQLVIVDRTGTAFTIGNSATPDIATA